MTVKKTALGFSNVRSLAAAIALVVTVGSGQRAAAQMFDTEKIAGYALGGVAGVAVLMANARYRTN